MEYYLDEQYLAHYGVKGMRWGVRRYQNSDGTLTSAGQKRLSSYKTNELARNDKKYDNLSKLKRRRKIESKITKATESGNSKRVEKLTTSRERIDKTVQYNNAMRKIEKSKIKNMTFSQMNNEKHAVKVAHGKAVVMSTLESGLGTAILLPTTGRIYISTRVVNKDAIKTNLRVSDDERKRVAQRVYGN